MKVRRLAGFGRSGRGASAFVAAVLVPAALAGGGPAAAAGRPVGASWLGGGPAPGVISTVAGGVGGPARATKVALGFPCGVAYGAGRVYVADGAAVRAVNRHSDWLTSPVGTGASGPIGDGGPATRASMGTCSAVVDHSGNLVIADSGNNRIRVVAARSGTFYGQAMKAAHIYTIAGGGHSGLGDGGPATSAELKGPTGVAVDAAGNLVITDTANQRVRMVAAQSGTFYGQTVTAGDIYTIAGNGTQGSIGDGGPATSAEFYQPLGVALDAAGNVIIADEFNQSIRLVAARSGTFYGQPMTAGDIYGIGGASYPLGVGADAAGNAFVSDTSHDQVLVVAGSTGTFYGQAMTAGHVYILAGDGTGGFAGDGGPAASAELSAPAGEAVDAAGNVLIADLGNRRIRVVAARSGTFYGQAMKAGDIYTIAGDGKPAFSGDGGSATRAQLSGPQSVADAAGNVVIADTSNQRVRVVPGSTGTFYGQPMTGGDIYTIAGDGTAGFSGNGRPGTGAELKYPSGVAVDAAGNAVIADSGNRRIRVVAARLGTFYGQAMTAGDIYTIAGDGSRGFAGDGGPAIAARLRGPETVAVDAAGNVVIADTGNNRIRVVAARSGTFYGQSMTAGDIYTIAGDGSRGFAGDGGPATSAEFDFPQGVAVDAAGNVLIADHNNRRVRVVAVQSGTFYGQAMTAGDIYTIAGDGQLQFHGDGGPGTSAALAAPSGVAGDAAGNAIIADTGHSRVRVLAGSTGTFYGQSMTAGDIYTIAGHGGRAFFGDGGPATRAEVNFPQGVAVDGAGNVLIADTGNGRIRVIGG